jgi:HEPN domain-containing protein
MERKRIRDLIAKASNDFELATKHKQIKEYVTATLLYNSAVEKVLKALFMSRTKKQPPANVSIEYLAKTTGVPEEISAYISAMHDDSTEHMGPVDFVDLDRETSFDRGAERQAFYMDGLAKRMIDYVTAYAKI